MDTGDDDVPIVFKSSRANRKLRARGSAEDESTPVGDVPAAVETPSDLMKVDTDNSDAVLAPAKKPSTKPSFADDSEEGDGGVDILQFKRKKKSNLVAKEKKKRDKYAEGPSIVPASSAAGLQPSYLSSADDYTPDKLESLRKSNTPFVLKPLSKTDQSNSLEALGLVSGPIEDDGEEQNADDIATAMEVDEPLPSQKEIESIKAKRERIRQFGSAAPSGADGALARDKDFIGLGNLDEEEDASRIVRDSAFDDDEAEATEALGQDYNGGRIAFGDPGKSYTSKVQNASAKITDEFDEDEEWRRWETQQLMKTGVKRGGADDEETAALAKRKSQTSQQKLQLIEPAYVPIPSIDEILAAIGEELSDLQTAHVQNKLHLVKMQGHIADVAQDVDSLDKEYTQISESFPFFEEMKRYVNDLLDCVGTKMADIEKLEQEWLQASINRVRATWRRASQLAQDEKAEVKELMSGSMPAGSVIKERESRSGDREKIVRRKLHRRERSNTNRNSTNLPDGWSSDEDDYTQFVEQENTTNSDLAFEEEATFATTCREIYHKGVAIFDDVYDDFSDVRSIADRFEEWKRREPKSYAQAYIPNSMPSLFDPFVRLELLMADWDPLFKNPLFDHMRWYRILVTFGGDDMPDNDEDRNLVPNLIEKSLLPRLRSTLNSLFDPMSSSQNRRLFELIDEILIYLPPEKLTDILSIIRVNLQGACDRIDLLQMTVDLSQTDPRVRNYAAKQLARATKVLQNCLLWTKFIPQNLILSTIMETIDSKLIPNLRSCLQHEKPIPVLCLEALNQLVSHFPVNIALSQAAPLLTDLVQNPLLRRMDEILKNFQANAHASGDDEHEVRRAFSEYSDILSAFALDQLAHRFRSV